MQTLLFGFINLRRLPAGRAAFALTKMRMLLNAAAVAAPNLDARLTDAMSAAKKTLHTDLRWSYARTQTSRSRGQAKAVDREVDRTVKAIYDRVAADTFGKPDDPVVVAATTIQKELFPEGLGAITRRAFDLQLAQVDTILERLEGDMDHHVQTLGLGRHVNNLRTINEQFRVELDIENGRELTFVAVEAQRKELHQAICYVIAAAFTDLHEPTAENLALLPTLLKPIEVQSQAVLDATRQKRRERDVDPKTGEERDDDQGTDEPVEGQTQPATT